MHSFVNDYSEGAHPRVLELLVSSNFEINAGYGLDVHCDRARQYIKKLVNIDDIDIHFIPGGTQTNLLAISSFLRPHQGVISVDTGHIEGHETGAIEATGHKILTCTSKDGKLRPEDIEKILEANTEEYTVRPKMVYISNTTELGTIYTKEELTAINKVCKKNGLILFMDGARLGSALTCSANDLKLEDIANLVDAFYIGGTKNGALLGEALVIVRDDLKEDFRHLLKQKGAMLAKGFVMGIQFEALFEDNLYFELATHANKMAEQLTNIIREYDYEFFTEPVSNQLFPIFPNTLLERMEKEFKYLIQCKFDENNTVVRIVTSWATTQDSIDAFKIFLKENVAN